MRRVPIQSIQEGSQIGKSLYNADGKILLREGTGLNESKKDRLEKLGYHSIYITDMLSGGHIDDVVNPEIRIKSIKNVKEVFDSFKIYLNRLSQPSASNMNTCRKMEYENVATISGSALDIVEDLINKKNNLVNIVDIKTADGYLYQHSVNVAVLAVTFGIKLGFNQSQLTDLAIGGMLHDIGYNFFDYDSIKDFEIADEKAIEIINEHPKTGYEYIKNNIDVNAHIKLMVLQHHEWLNGSGYPNGVKGEEISVFARIIAIADMYDALTSDKLHREALCPHEANERMLASSMEQLDPDLVKEFIKIIIPYPVGTVVKLTNGEIGVVIGLDTDFPLRPKVKVVKQVNRKVELYTRDLLKENSICIDSVQYELPDSLFVE